MERRITLADLKKIKPGQQILASLFNGRDEVLAFSCKMKEPKYPCTNKDGIKSRSLGHVKNKGIQFITAQQEGCDPDTMITAYSFTGFGELTIKDYEVDELAKAFKIRIIDKAHPKYSPHLTQVGKQFNTAFKMMAKMFPD